MAQINEAEKFARMRKRVEEALYVHLARNDTNNGKTYCIDCDANERAGIIRHKRDCIHTDILLAVDSFGE